jgi:hypothetical protein
MLPIVFGYPMPELFEAEQRGEVALGGCVVTGEDPTHRCAACGADVILDDDAPLLCAACGRPLLGDLEDDPAGESGLPLCGECDRARNFDAMLEPEALDGSTLSGEGGW